MPNMHLPHFLAAPLLGAVNRLEIKFDPRISIKRVQRYPFTWHGEGQYVALFLVACLNLYICESPGLFGKLFIVSAYTAGLLVPFTSQFVLPATPIFAWLLLFWSAKFIPVSVRPHIWVSVLPTLETVLYGADISDLLTRTTNPALDVLAWIPYGVIHFVFPFVTAALIWIFGPPGGVKFFAKVFGYLNFFGVITQILFPCAPPWYELLHGQTPANYSMKGSPGGLARIDALFGGNGYTNTFTNAPVPFGAFPSLHAGCSTADALLLNHFFPQYRFVYIAYVLWLYWSTMYLTHHYLIDLVAGAALALACLYFFLNEDPVMRDWQAHFPAHASAAGQKPSSPQQATAVQLDAGNGYAFPRGADDVELELGRPSGDALDYELPASRDSADGSVGTASASASGAGVGAGAGMASSTLSQSGAGRESSAAAATAQRTHQNPFLAAPSMSKEGSRDSDGTGVARPRTPRTGDRQ